MTNGKKTRRPWPIHKLGDVLDIETTSIVPVSGTRYRYVGLEHIEQQTGRIVEAPVVDGVSIQSAKYIFNSSHVLYGKLRPYLNKVAIPHFAGICSTDILPLAVRRNVLSKYLAYYLRSPAFVHYATLHATGTKMPRFGPRQLLQATIPLPPLPVQERIVMALDIADEIHRKRQEALDLADAILSASFAGMFGDPSKNSTNYERFALGDLADVRSGVTKGRKLRGKATVEAPYLRVANVQDGFLDLTEIKTIEVLPEDIDKFHLEDGDILMTEGGDPDKLGRGCIWRSQIEGCIHQNHVFRVRTDRERLAPEYLAALLRTQYAKHYFLSCAKRSSNLASVNSTQVKAFPVPLPSVRLQQKFVSAVDQWVQSSDRLTSGLADARRLFASLLGEAFNGQLTTEWEAINAERIASTTEYNEKLPRLLVLALLAEKKRQATRISGEVLMTTLMNYVFLLQAEGYSACRRLYQFAPSQYGPYAKEIHKDIESLQAEGMVTVEINVEEDTTLIELSNVAKADEVLAGLPDDLREDAATVIEKYGDSDHSTLLMTVYEKYPTYKQKSSRSRKPTAGSRQSSPSGKGR